MLNVYREEKKFLLNAEEFIARSHMLEQFMIQDEHNGALGYKIRSLYFDTAYVLRNTSKDTFKQILEKHGSHKILFASDSPWSDMEEDVKIIKSFGLDKNTEEKIFCENAKLLLGI